jgi:acetyl esterase/lipase
VIAGSAELYRPPLSLLALHCNMPVYSVDYSLAPEAKCPQQAVEYASVLRYLM